MTVVDVLITTNYTEYLTECLNSIPKSDNINIHLLFHNTKKEEVDHPNIKSVNEFNGKTVSEARLFLYKSVYAKSKCVLFLDSDDMLKENYFEETLRYFDEYQEFNLFHTDFSVLNTISEYEYPAFGTNAKLGFIKNPMIRVSNKKVLSFNADLKHDEYAPIYSQIGYENIFHIPKNLQVVRDHLKSHERTRRSGNK